MTKNRGAAMRGIFFFWLIGIAVPIIMLLYLFRLI
jgi:hypothetical protein